MSASADLSRGELPDVIVPPPVPLPVPPVLPPDPPERDDPTEPDWSDDELPPVVNQEDEDVPWAAFHLWRDKDGNLLSRCT